MQDELFEWHSPLVVDLDDEFPKIEVVARDLNEIVEIKIHDNNTFSVVMNRTLILESFELRTIVYLGDATEERSYSQTFKI